ncbi:MAG: tRNA (N6-threonylcarbamoyladenosine(37)-N6)-methyltransferase TrmO [Candidatus Lokiarchaeota archaeon]|nr:tRNA (N6-threonylcarbamoyladenosine(37)-N6)-methyltransferase TrmO [Candidatus Lokiarchaeota archaeon]
MICGDWILTKIELKPIGIVRCSLTISDNIPVQPKFSEIEGEIEIFEKYNKGLKDLEDFEYVICIAYLHHVKLPVSLQSSTHWDNEKHGVFAIRTPRRPNPIGLSVFKLLKIEANILSVKNLDLVDETPVLDIKPFVPSIDNRETKNNGWIKGRF